MLEAGARGGNAHARLAIEQPPECPQHLVWLWETYRDIAKGRPSGGLGAPRLTWPALESWMRVRKRSLSQYEIDLIFDLDDTEPKDFYSDD